MPLEFPNDLVALSKSLQRFMMTHAAALPEHAREALIEFAGYPSPVDRIVNSAEALYAVKADLDKEGRDLCAQLARFAAVNGWHGMGQRGTAIADAMQRIGGYDAPPGTSWPPAEDDPAPLERFMAPAEEPEGEPGDEE